MREKLKELFDGCMRGRTMYVLPFSMGPVGSPMSQIGVQLLTRLTWWSTCASWRGSVCRFSRRSTKTRSASCLACTPSARRCEGQKDVPWPCNKEKYIVHFPETREIWSYGSGYGGNALLG